MNETPIGGKIPLEQVQSIAETIWDKKGFDVQALDVAEIVGYTDVLVLCSATSDRHAKALADAVQETMRKRWDRKPTGQEGANGGRWILVDYTDVVVHIFHRPVRAYYELDRLYTDAPHLPLEIPEGVKTAEREREFASAGDWDEIDSATFDDDELDLEDDELDLEDDELDLEDDELDLEDDELNLDDDELDPGNELELEDEPALESDEPKKLTPDDEYNDDDKSNAPQ